MRSRVWFGVLLVWLLSAGTLCAADFPQSLITDRPGSQMPTRDDYPPPLGPFVRPRPMAPGDPFFGGAVPDSTIPRETAVPAGPSDVQPGPQVPAPKTEIPSPVAPSEKPTGYAAPPVFPVEDLGGDYVCVEAEDTNTEFDESGKRALTVARGNVTVRFRNVVATCDSAEINYKTNLAVFHGNVVFRIGVQEARGSEVICNTRTREWSVSTALTTVTPEFAKGWLDAPVFADTQRLQGFGRRQINAFGGHATTCNLPFPHYELRAKSVTVYPDDKAILRQVAVFAFGRKLFTLPRLVIPLREIQENPNLIPRVGSTQEEGVFLKTQYALAGSKALSSFLLLDVMSRKGIGKGINQSYRLGSGSGTMQFYQIFDNNIQQNTMTGRLTHAQTMGTVKAALTTDFRSNSYLYAPQSQSLIGQLSLTRNQPGAATSLIVNQNINDAFQKTSRFASNLKHRQQFGLNTTLDTNFDYTALTTSGTQARLTSQGAFTRKEKSFDWSISAQKFTDLSDEAFVSQGGFGGIEKLPEIGLVTDTKRLGHTLFGIPAGLKVTYGDYVELPNPSSLRRTYFEANTPLQRFELSDTWTFGAGAGFRQYFYSDNTAQYSYDTSAQLSKKLGATSSFDLTYRYQKPRGYAPFRFDFVGKYNIATASLNYQDSRLVRLSLLTGYNFEQQSFPWQDVVLRMSVQPSPSFLVYTATGYDVNRSQWRTLINQVRVRASDTFKLDLGTRYDTTTKQLAEARVVLDTQLGKLWNLQANAGYNGFTDSFDYRSFMLTRDLHCWEASIVYINQGGFYQNEGFQFNLRIKAFPFFRDFGAGSFGQALDTSVGNVY